MKNLRLFSRAGIVRYTRLDDQDEEWASAIRWVAAPNGKGKVYVREGGVRHGRAMSTLLMERASGRSLQPGELVDHEDGDPLNNQRENLRLATYTQNACNNSLRSDSTTGFKGVSWHKGKRAYEVRLAFGKSRDRLGYFQDPEVAARVYDVAAIQVHGDFARTNFPRSDYPEDV